jgi:hypothetical protein
LEILGNLEFVETCPTVFLLDVIARKNKFPIKVDQKSEFLSKVGFELILGWFES